MNSIADRPSVIPHWVKKFVVAIVFLQLICAPAQAWNDVCHRGVALMVWRKFNTSERNAISTLLKQHPHYSTLASDVPANVTTNEWVFLNAAVWPDTVRPKTGVEKPESVTRYARPWHSAVIPFVWPLGATNVSVKNFQIPEPNALTGLSDSLACLTNRAAPGADRAVSLCWVLHITADIHMPLHAVTVVSREYPEGSTAQVIVDQQGELVRLHHLWDLLPALDLADHKTEALADAFMKRQKGLDKLGQYRTNKTVYSWAMESHELAKNFAYCTARIPWVDGNKVKSGKIAAAEVPRVSHEYIRDAKEIAVQRLALASGRLMALLKETKLDRE